MVLSWVEQGRRAELCHPANKPGVTWLTCYVTSGSLFFILFINFPAWARKMLNISDPDGQSCFSQDTSQVDGSKLLDVPVLEGVGTRVGPGRSDWSVGLVGCGIC